MSKFQEGDRVAVAVEVFQHFPLGSEGTVVKVYADTVTFPVQVVMDGEKFTEAKKYGRPFRFNELRKV